MSCYTKNKESAPPAAVVAAVAIEAAVVAIEAAMAAMAKGVSRAAVAQGVAARVVEEMMATCARSAPPDRATARVARRRTGVISY